MIVWWSETLTECAAAIADWYGNMLVVLALSVSDEVACSGCAKCGETSSSEVPGGGPMRGLVSPWPRLGALCSVW